MLYNSSKILIDRALSVEFATSQGVFRAETDKDIPAEFHNHPYVTSPGWVFPRRGLNGEVINQFRPDSPLDNPEGKPVKYVFPLGSPMGLTELRELGGAALVVEGTCQSLAALRYASPSLSIYGIEGCWNWRNGSLKTPAVGLERFENRRVTIVLDADATSNRSVYDAGIALKESLMAEGASEVLFMRLPGSGGTAGLDDVLGVRDEHLRAPYLARQIASASAKPADVKPMRKRLGVKPPPDQVTVPATDLDVSDAWLQRHGEGLRFNIDLQKWMAYVKGTWSINAGISLAQASFQDCIRNEVVAVTSDGGSEVVARDWLYSAKRIEAVLKQGAANRSYQVSDDQMDGNPWLWNAANCVINLKTGQPRDHTPEDFMSQQSRVVFDPEARAPKFQTWMTEILPNTETRKFVQRVLGQAMVGEVVEHIFPVFIGTGRNGKGTLLRLMAEIFGSYFTGLKKTVLVDTKYEQHATALATLQKKRLAVTEEMKATASYDVALIKSLTGGDYITANKMRQDDIVFKPSHTLLLASNHRPKVDQGETAFWSRYREVPFNRVFENPSDAIEEAMKTPDELSGILNWLLEGLADYRTNGLGEPEEVMWASAAAKVEADPLYEFIEDNIFHTGDDGDWIEAKSVREKYEVWCERRRKEPLKPRGFREIFAVASRSELGQVRAEGRAGISAYRKIRWVSDEDVVSTRDFVVSTFGDETTPNTSVDQAKHDSVVSVVSVVSEKGYISSVQKTSLPPKKEYTVQPIEREISELRLQKDLQGSSPAETPKNHETTEEPTKRLQEPNSANFALDTSSPVSFGLQFWRDLGAKEYEPPICDHCGTRPELVPPGLFWYACRSCFPATFERS